MASFFIFLWLGEISYFSMREEQRLQHALGHFDLNPADACNLTFRI